MGRALAWAATAPAARNETFNVTNGDVFLWEYVWPAIAETLGMEPGDHRPFSFQDELPNWQGEWAAIVARHGLAAPVSIMEFVGFNSLVYADVMLSGVARSPIPTLNSTIKIRQAGFGECMDTEDMFRGQFLRLVERRLIPGAR
jgi:hypothetical protein